MFIGGEGHLLPMPRLAWWGPGVFKVCGNSYIRTHRMCNNNHILYAEPQCSQFWGSLPNYAQMVWPRVTKFGVMTPGE